MMSIFTSLLAFALLSWTALHCQAQQTTVGGRTLRDNQWVVGNHDRQALEDTTTNAYDKIVYSYYQTLTVNRGYTAESDFLPQNIRGRQYALICVGQAWAKFDQLAREDPTSSFYLFTHLTVPAGKPLHRNRQLIHNCIILKDPGTGDLQVASPSFNQNVYRILRWKLGWDITSDGKYGKP